MPSMKGHGSKLLWLAFLCLQACDGRSNGNVSAASSGSALEGLGNESLQSSPGYGMLGQVISALEKGGQIDVMDIHWNATQLWRHILDEFSWGHSFENTSDPVRQNESAIATALAYGLKAGLLHPPGKLAFGDDSYVPFSEPSASNTLSTQEVPGITAVVYEEFFTKASAVAVQLLEENFKKVKLNSVTAVARVPVLGDFDIKLENVRLEGIKLDQSTTGVSLGDDGNFDLVVSGMDAIVSGHFQWRRTKFPFISGGCQAQVTAVNGNVRLKVTVVGDAAGRPKIADMDAAHLSFDSLNIVTSGAKLSWLYNAVAAFAHTQIQDAITRAVGKQVSTTVPSQINALLDGVPTIVHIKGLDLNTSLARSPKVTPDRLILWDWGRFQNPNHKLQGCPFQRTVDLSAQDGPILPGGSPYQIIADIDESIVNCLTWDMFKTGKLHAQLQGDDLPEKALYTDSWRFVIPEVWFRCPGCPMAVNATVTSAPNTQIHETHGIVSKGTADLSFFLAEDQSEDGVPWTPSSAATSELTRPLEAEQMPSRRVLEQERETQDSEQHSVHTDDGILSSGESCPQGNCDKKRLKLGDHLFTLSLSGELAVHNLTLDPDPYSQGWRLNLSMKVNQAALKVGVKESDVGKINEAALHFALTVASFLVEDKVNHGILADGFLLPSIPHVKVERANVTVVDHALAIGADFSYVK